MSWKPPVFNVDRKILARIARQVERVLIIDPNAASARMLGEILKELGSRQPIYAQRTEQALAIAREFDPQVIFVEIEGAELDGVDFTTRLRRSNLPARKAPIIVLASNPREGSIKAARDSGAHEFLCKPFTAGHLFKRVENVTLKPRLWIEAKMYVGPDRRRFNSGDFEGAKKRRADSAESQKLACAFAAAEAAFSKSLDLFEERPQLALKGMLEQATLLQGAAFHHQDPDLAAAITSLLAYLHRGVESGLVDRSIIQQHLVAVRALRDGKAKLSGPERAQLLLKLTGASQAVAA